MKRVPQLWWRRSNCFLGYSSMTLNAPDTITKIVRHKKVNLIDWIIPGRQELWPEKNSQTKKKCLLVLGTRQHLDVHHKIHNVGKMNFNFLQLSKNKRTSVVIKNPEATYEFPCCSNVLTGKRPPQLLAAYCQKSVECHCYLFKPSVTLCGSEIYIPHPHTERDDFVTSINFARCWTP